MIAKDQWFRLVRIGLRSYLVPTRREGWLYYVWAIVLLAIFSYFFGIPAIFIGLAILFIDIIPVMYRKGKSQN